MASFERTGDRELTRFASRGLPTRLAAILSCLLLLLAATTASGPPGAEARLAGGPPKGEGRTAFGPSGVGAPTALIPSGEEVRAGGFRTWAALYGGITGEEMEGIWATSDGGSIVAGITESYGEPDGDAWLVKLDAYGEIEWQKVYGGAKADMLIDVRQTSDGGYIAAGWTESYGQGQADFWVVRLSATGGIQWQKTYGGTGIEQAWSIEPVSTGGYIVAGGTTSFGAGGADYWVLKLTDTGGITWQKAYGGAGNDGGGGTYEEYVVRVLEDEDGNFVVASHTFSFGHGEDDIWVVKLDTSGDVIWQKAYGDGDENSMWAFQEAAGGGYIVPGVTVVPPDWSGDLWTLKLAKNGSIVWQKVYRLAGYWSEALSVGATSDGGALIGGYYEQGSADWDMYLLRIDATGGILWTKLFEYGWDWPNAVQQLPDGGFVVAGVVWPNGTQPLGLVVMRLDRYGEISPFCSVFSDLTLNPSNTATTVINTSATVTTTTATAQNSTAGMTNSPASPNFLCQGAALEIFVGEEQPCPR